MKKYSGNKKFTVIILVMCLIGLILTGCNGNKADTSMTAEINDDESDDSEKGTLADDSILQDDASRDSKAKSVADSELDADAELEEDAELKEDAEHKEDEGMVDITLDGHESAIHAVASMGAGWNLGNSLDCTGDWIVESTEAKPYNYEMAWGNPITPSNMMAHIKELGFNTVRIPITWNNHFDDNGKIDDEWMNRVVELVDQALDEDLYVIINVHHDTGAEGWLRATGQNYDQNKDKFARLWNSIAKRFEEYPDKLIFEGMNEILDDNNEQVNPSQDSLEAVNRYNKLFVDTVRKSGGVNEYRNLICNTYAASTTDIVLNAFEMPSDDCTHLIAEVHCYMPYEFVSYDVNWTQPISEYNSYVEGELDKAIQRLDKKFVSHNIPLVIGEFGTEDKGNTQDRAKWAGHLVDKASEIGVPCIVWDNGEYSNMGLVSRSNGKDPFPEIIEVVVAPR